MLYFDRIDVYEGIDVNTTSESKECSMCHYWLFLSKGFNFHPNVCNRCHDLLLMSMNLSNIAVLNITGFYYRCIICGIRKNKCINIKQNSDLTKKAKHYKTQKFIIANKNG